MSTLAPTAAATTTWKIDPVHSVAEFKVKHMMISNVKGQFTNVTGTLLLDHNNVAGSSVEAEIEVASINTRDAGRDEHLKGADFFHAEQFPTMKMKSIEVKHDRSGDLVVTGDLT